MSYREDPQPYYGPIERADGMRPFNGHLWPTELWTAHSEVYELRNFLGTDRMAITHLADGRWSTDGFVRCIEKNVTTFGQRCCFATRDQAIRAVAARLIVSMRRQSRNPHPHNVHAPNPSIASAIINWARAVAARETGKPEPTPVAHTVRLPALPHIGAGLPLFDFQGAQA